MIVVTFFAVMANGGGVDKFFADTGALKVYLMAKGKSLSEAKCIVSLVESDISFDLAELICWQHPAGCFILALLSIGILCFCCRCCCPRKTRIIHVIRPPV